MDSFTTAQLVSGHGSFPAASTSSNNTNQTTTPNDCDSIGDLTGSGGLVNEVSKSSTALLSLSLSEITGFINSIPDTLFPRRRLFLPKVQKTLVLDLDETLVHSTSKSSRNYDAMIEVLVGKSSCLYYVFKRPHVDLFLKKVK